MTFNHGGGLWVLSEEVSQVFDVTVAFWFDLSLVEVELDVQLYTYGFSWFSNDNFFNHFFNHNNLLIAGAMHPAISSSHTGTYDGTTTGPRRAFNSAQRSEEHTSEL